MNTKKERKTAPSYKNIKFVQTSYQSFFWLLFFLKKNRSINAESYELCRELGNADLRSVVSRDIGRCTCADRVECVVCAEVSVLARYVCCEEVKFFVPYERCRRLCCKADACFAFLVFVNINICLGFTCEEVETVAAFNSFNVNVLCSYGVLCCCEIVAAHRASEE